MKSSKQRKVQESSGEESGSDDEDGEENAGGDTTISVSVEELIVGVFVIVTYEGEFFPGVITSIIDYGVIYNVEVMVMSGPKHWKWPDRPDKLNYPIGDVVEIISPPILKNNRGECIVEEIKKYQNISF